MRFREIRDDADGCVHVLSRMHRLRFAVAAEAGRLLRVLLLRIGEVPADSGAGGMQRVMRRPHFGPGLRLCGHFRSLHRRPNPNRSAIRNSSWPTRPSSRSVPPVFRRPPESRCFETKRRLRAGVFFVRELAAHRGVPVRLSPKSGRAECRWSTPMDFWRETGGSARSRTASVALGSPTPPRPLPLPASIPA
jgi:hypothetical protein